MKKVFKTLIVDDEPLARQRLKRLLADYPQFDIEAEAANGKEAIELIDSLHPEIVFLDIEMPIYNGFEVLSNVKKQPKVIFTTAYDQYAIKAFEENSVDYLLKPIEKERLEKAVTKFMSLFANNADLLPLEKLIAQFNPKKTIKSLTIKIGDRILLIKLENIIFLEAEDKYVFIHTIDGEKLLTDFTITVLEEKLSDEFVKIHRSIIINSDKIKEIRKSFNGALVFVMNNKEQSRLSSSRSHGESLKDRFEI